MSARHTPTGISLKELAQGFKSQGLEVPAHIQQLLDENTNKRGKKLPDISTEKFQDISQPKNNDLTVKTFGKPIAEKLVKKISENNVIESQQSVDLKEIKESIEFIKGYLLKNTPKPEKNKLSRNFQRRTQKIIQADAFNPESSTPFDDFEQLSQERYSRIKNPQENQQKITKLTPKDALHQTKKLKKEFTDINDPMLKADHNALGYIGPTPTGYIGSAPIDQENSSQKEASLQEVKDKEKKQYKNTQKKLDKIEEKLKKIIEDDKEYNGGLLNSIVFAVGALIATHWKEIKPYLKPLVPILHMVGDIFEKVGKFIGFTAYQLIQGGKEIGKWVFEGVQEVKHIINDLDPFHHDKKPFNIYKYRKAHGLPMHIKPPTITHPSITKPATHNTPTHTSRSKLITPSHSTISTPKTNSSLPSANDLKGVENQLKQVNTEFNSFSKKSPETPLHTNTNTVPKPTIQTKTKTLPNKFSEASQIASENSKSTTGVQTLQPIIVKNNEKPTQSQIIQKDKSSPTSFVIKNTERSLARLTSEIYDDPAGYVGLSRL